jgi:hypothetical protein
MDDHNFWYWVLEQIKEFLLVYFFPFIPRHVDMGIAAAIVSYAGPILGLFYIAVGSFIHLGTLFKIIQLLLLIQLVHLILASRKIIARLIKLGASFGLLG